MPPRQARPRRGTQSAAARAWDRAINHLKDIGAKITRSAATGGPSCGLSETEVDSCVNDLSVIIVKADNDNDSATPGVWAALNKAGGTANLLGLFAVAARCSCASLAPGLPNCLRLLHAKLRNKLSYELTQVFEDVEARLSKADARTIARGLLSTHLLRCYTALLSDATAPLMLELNQRTEASAFPAAAANPDLARPSQRTDQHVMSPPRRLVKTLSELLREAVDVLWYLKEVTVHYDAADCPATGWRLGAELSSTRFLDLVARGLLLLAACEGCGREAADLLEPFVASVNAVRHKIEGPNNLLAASPSLSFLLSAHVAQLAATLDGGDGAGGAASASAIGGLPATTAPWSAPLLLRVGGTRTLLDLTDAEGGSIVSLAGLALALWASACRCETLDGSPPFTFANVTVDVVAQYLPLESVLPLAPPTPPRSLRQAAGGQARRLALTMAFADCAQDVVDRGLGGALMEPSVQQHMEQVKRDASAELKRLRRLLAPGATAPPLNAVATVDLCLRLTAAAWRPLASSGGGAAGAGGGAAAARRHGAGFTLPQQPQGQMLTRTAASGVALEALVCAKAACGLLVSLAARVELPRRAVQQLEICWREWLAWAGVKAGSRGAEAQRGLDEWEWTQVGPLLALGAANVGGVLPAQPPVPLAAAISAGYLPGLEWLLRRLSAPDLQQPLSASLLNLVTVHVGSDHSGSWQQLLAFAPRHDIARLVDTLADMLAQPALQIPDGAFATASGGGTAASGSGGGDGPEGGSWCQLARRGSGGSSATAAKPLADPWAAALQLLRALEAVLSCCKFKPAPRGDAAAATSQPQEQPPPQADGAGDAGGGEESVAAAPLDGDAAAATAAATAAAVAASVGILAAEAQLGAVMSYLAVRLLPVVSELLRRMTSLIIAKVNKYNGQLSLEVGLVLQWINMLAAAAAAAGTGATAAAPEASGAAQGMTAAVATAAAAASEVAVGTAAPDAGPSLPPPPTASASTPSSPATAAEPAAEAVAQRWADVLVREVGVFSFLRAAIALQRLTRTTLLSVSQLQETLGALAAAMPRQLAEALAEEEVPAPAAPAPARKVDAGGGSFRSLWEEVRWLVTPGERASDSDPGMLAELEGLRQWAAAGAATGAPLPPRCGAVERCAEGLWPAMRARAEALISPEAAWEMQPAPTPTAAAGVGVGPGPNPVLR